MDMQIYLATSIVFAIVITSYQMTMMIVQFFDNSTATVINRVEPDELLYPPLKICYSHWVAWVNFSAAEEMNFTQPEVYYSMSYLSANIYCAVKFDIKKTAASFFKKLSAKNLTMSQFFLKIANKFDPLVLGLLEETPLNYSAEIKPLDFITPLPNRYYVLCYTFSEATIAKLALSVSKKEDENGGKTGQFVSRGDTYTLIINPSLLEPVIEGNQIDKGEQDYYIKYLSGIITNFPPPPFNKMFPIFLYINAYQGTPLVVNSGTPVFVKVKASGFIWKNTNSNPCVKDRPYILENRTCHDKCVNKFDIDQYHCNDGRYLEYSFTESNFYFLEDEKFKSRAYPRCLPESTSPFEQLTLKKNHECINQCRSEVGCLVWTYDIAAERKLQNGLVSIQYPIPEHTVILEKIDLLTWENFIAKIGGLLAIWMLQIWIVCFCFYRSKGHSKSLQL